MTRHWRIAINLQIHWVHRIATGVWGGLGARDSASDPLRRLLRGFCCDLGGRILGLGGRGAAAGRGAAPSHRVACGAVCPPPPSPMTANGNAEGANTHPKPTGGDAGEGTGRWARAGRGTAGRQTPSWPRDPADPPSVNGMGGQQQSFRVPLPLLTQERSGAPGASL